MTLAVGRRQAADQAVDPDQRRWTWRRWWEGAGA